MLHVALAPSGTDAHDLLRTLLEQVGAGGPVSRRCAACGSTAHGGPAHASWWLSLSRSPDVVAAVATVVGPVGVDVEQDARTAFEGFDRVALAPGERDGAAPARCRLWTRKEAVLKATGHGLTLDPRSVRVDAATCTVDGRRAQLLDLPAPPGSTCSAAVLAPARPDVVLHDLRAAAAAPGARASG